MINKIQNIKRPIELRNLKVLLVFWTIIGLTLVVLFLSNHVRLELPYKILIIAIAFTIRGLFILFIWKRKEFDKKFKTNNSILIFFLGILGMWFFILDKKVKNLEEKPEAVSS